MKWIDKVEYKEILWGKDVHTVPMIKKMCDMLKLGMEKLGKRRKNLIKEREFVKFWILVKQHNIMPFGNSLRHPHQHNVFTSYRFEVKTQ